MQLYSKKVLDTIQKVLASGAVAFAGTGLLAAVFDGSHAADLFLTGFAFGGMLLIFRLYRGRYGL